MNQSEDKSINQVRFNYAVMVACEFRRAPVLKENSSINFFPTIFTESNVEDRVSARHFGIRLMNDDHTMECYVEYVGVFQNAGAGQAEFERFLKYNAVAILIPYVRETIQAILQRSGVQSSPFPIINVFEFVDQFEKELEEGKVIDR